MIFDFDHITVEPSDIGKTLLRHGPWGARVVRVRSLVDGTHMDGGPCWEDMDGMRYPRRLHVDHWCTWDQKDERGSTSRAAATFGSSRLG